MINMNKNWKHGSPKIYKRYYNILSRCNNKNLASYKNYGGRGIKCEWNSFEEFYNDMGLPENDNFEIDRIDNNGNYCKENCRWVSSKENGNNKRSNHYIEYNGKKQSMMKWCNELNLQYYRVRARLRRGWSIEDTFNKDKQINQFTNK